MNNISEKKNPEQMIFHHILYECLMYFQSYETLCRPKAISVSDETNKEAIENAKILYKILNNMTLESHQIHLRNLIEFFNNKENNGAKEEFEKNILIKNILNDTEKFKIDMKEIEGAHGDEYKIFCRATEHLGKQRFIEPRMKEFQIIAINNMEKIIPKRIRTFIDMLDDKSNVIGEYFDDNNNAIGKYSDDLYDPYIQNIIMFLKQYCEKYQEISI